MVKFKAIDPAAAVLLHKAKPVAIQCLGGQQVACLAAEKARTEKGVDLLPPGLRREAVYGGVQRLLLYRCGELQALSCPVGGLPQCVQLGFGEHKIPSCVLVCGVISVGFYFLLYHT
ncbi:MAG: hypothetical protein LUD82_08985 [Clostridiales bacterium]|nr:hypothetical protein [Clostridiales bacterium]